MQAIEPPLPLPRMYALTLHAATNTPDTPPTRRAYVLMAPASTLPHPALTPRACSVLDMCFLFSTPCWDVAAQCPSTTLMARRDPMPHASGFASSNRPPASVGTRLELACAAAADHRTSIGARTPSATTRAAHSPWWPVRIVDCNISLRRCYRRRMKSSLPLPHRTPHRTPPGPHVRSGTRFSRITRGCLDSECRKEISLRSRPQMRCRRCAYV